MNRRKIGQIGAIFYTILYAAAMLTPRKLSSHDEGTLKNSHFFKRIIHEILYYGGALEPVANFLFLIPIFAYLILFLGGSKAHYWLAICVAICAIIEILQRFIPGRVSSLQDLLLNCLGTVSTFLLYKIALKANFLK